MDAKNRKIPGLLVSVRDEHEAAIVDQAGVDILDIKEPTNGALGRADAKVIDCILANVDKDTKISAAFGDLDQCEIFLSNNKVCDGLAFAKCGLARAAFVNWQSRIEAVWNGFRQAGCEPVAVAYADHTHAFSPKPKEILEWAIEKNIEYFLIDTFDKQKLSLFDFLSSDDLQDLLLLARENNVSSVLAGSIRRSHLETVKQLSPEFVGVRGAVCSSDRGGEVKAELVLEFKKALHAFESAV